MAADNSEQLVLLNLLADEFAERYRSGERPSLSEYIQRHPDLADDIREFFPALVEMEQVKEERQAVSEPKAIGPLPPLERLGDFRIIREIGHGGMGVVYEAEQVSLGRHVALKVLPQKLLVDARTRGRFEREAKAAAKLHHTNIVPVFGVGEHDGLPYYVMQFIPGLGLDEVLEELKKLQAGVTGAVSAGRIKEFTGGELRVTRKDVSAVAQSLITGRFARGLGQDFDRATPRHDRRPALQEARVDTTDASSQSSDVQGSPNETPVTGRLSDTFSLSSSSVVMPGTGKRAGKRQLTYWQSVAHIGVQVADALEYAHRQGIQHRDIKPSNLLLDTAGTVWVTDFGLAKADDQQNLTQAGDVLGTLRYMPPEAFDGKTDARGDVYALGLTLYELLAFRPAFGEKDRNRIIKQVTTQEPPRLDRLNSDLPRDLVTIVHKAIEHEPGHRYPTAGALHADLKRFLDDEPIQARRQTHVERYLRWARRNPVIAALGGVLTAVLVVATVTSLLAAGYFNRLRQSEAQAAQSERQARYEADQARAADEKSRLAAQAETFHAYHALLSEVRALRAEHASGWRDKALGDLARLGAMAAPPRDLIELRTEAAATLATPDIRLMSKIALPTDSTGSVVFSPDGQSLLTTSIKKGLDFWDLAGKQRPSSVKWLKVIQDASRFDKAVYLADGKRLAVATRDEGVVFTDTQGRRLSTAAITQGSSQATKLAISANGRRIAVAWTGGAGITVHDLGNGALLEKFKDAGAPFALSPDGLWLAREESAEIALLPIASGEPRIVLGRHAGAIALAFSPNGAMLAGAFSDHTVVLWDVAKREQLGTLRGHRERVLDVAFSPDGEWIATGCLDYTARIWETRTGRTVAMLSGSSSPAVRVQWSPTGEYLAVDMKNAQEVFLYSITGRHQVQQWLSGHRVELRGVAAHPHQERLATSGYLELNTWDLSLSRPTLVPLGPNPGAVTALAYSPDGSLLATASWLGANPREVVVRDAITNQVRSRITWPNIVEALAFTPMGERIACGDQTGNISLWDIASSQPDRPVKQFRTGSAVHSIIFLDNPPRLVSHGKDAVFVFNVESEKPERKVELAGGDIQMLAADPGRSRLVVGFKSGAIGGLSLPDLTPGPHLVNAHQGPVSCLALSPDGRLLASGAEHRVVLRDARTFETLLALPLWAGTLRDLTFDSQGRRLAIVGTDSDVDLWDLAALHDGLKAIGLSWDRTGEASGATQGEQTE